jgi:hypothetical protein
VKIKKEEKFIVVDTYFVNNGFGCRYRSGRESEKIQFVS